MRVRRIYKESEKAFADADKLESNATSSSAGAWEDVLGARLDALIKGAESSV